MGHVDQTLTGAAIRVRVDIGVVAMKEYSTLTIHLEVEPHHQMQFSIIFRHPFLGGSMFEFRLFFLL